MQEVQHKMINYQIVTSTKEKQVLKDGFQSFFKDAYSQILSDNDWKHQFLHSPYEESTLFLAFDNNKIVGSALMIPQKYKTKRNQGTYYLWTTSAVLKDYRSQGVYAKLLSLQREHAYKNQKDFIFAFPNKLAYPVVKLFGGFRDLYQVDLVKTSIDMLDLKNIENSLVIDEDFFRWRFEHKDYLFYEIENHIIISKRYENALDVLAIYKKEDMADLSLELQNETISKDIITISSFLKQGAVFNGLDKLSGTYFPINKDIDYNIIKLNLLMSDIF